MRFNKCKTELRKLFQAFAMRADKKMLSLIIMERMMMQCMYTVSQKTSHLWLAITLTHLNGFSFLGRNITDKVGNQKTLYNATSSNLCFCTTWQNGKTQKLHFQFFHSVGLCYTYTMHLCAVFLKEKVVICDVFYSV